MQGSEVRRLSDLLEVSRTLAGAVHLRPALDRVLDLLAENHGLLAGSVALLDEGSGELHVEAAHGPDAAEAWIKENPDALGPWLEGVTTLSGEPGLDAVKSALGL